MENQLGLQSRRQGTGSRSRSVEGSDGTDQGDSSGLRESTLGHPCPRARGSVEGAGPGSADPRCRGVDRATGTAHQPASLGGGDAQGAGHSPRAQHRGARRPRRGATAVSARPAARDGRIHAQARRGGRHRRPHRSAAQKRGARSAAARDRQISPRRRQGHRGDLPRRRRPQARERHSGSPSGRPRCLSRSSPPSANASAPTTSSSGTEATSSCARSSMLRRRTPSERWPIFAVNTRRPPGTPSASA